MRIEISEVINRPIDDVFAYLSDPKKHAEWVGPVLGDSNVSEGAMHEGTTFHEDGKLLGRKLGSDWTVTKYEPPHRYEQEARMRGAHVRIGFTLTPEGDRTRVVGVTEGEIGGLFKIADSVVARVLKNQQQTDLDNLKLILESGEPA
jgi:uncharacterized protein YndB with AHSA1/START domain